jgi:hypothetical protein
MALQPSALGWGWAAAGTAAHHLNLLIRWRASDLKPQMYRAAAKASAQDSLQGRPEWTITAALTGGAPTGQTGELTDRS